VDEQKIWDLIDQMRISIPEEVKKANEPIRSATGSSLKRTKKPHACGPQREEAAAMVSEHELTQAAEERATTIVERAKRDAESLRADADEYVIQVLESLGTDLERALKEVRNGVARVQQETARSG